MVRIDVCSERGGYPVIVGDGVLGRLEGILRAEALTLPAAAVSNVTVGPLYARDVARKLTGELPFELADGEEHKRWAAVEAICGHWLDRQVHRSNVVLAVGGGVVTDIVGFAAAVYQRGIDWVAVPTTLLAMVDAAVGGKTGVNLDQGKNLVGSFWPPRAVVADVATLRTLPERETRAGLAEVVKAAWIGDRALLDLVASLAADPDLRVSVAWEQAVARSVRVKAEVVAADEREAGRRKALNLGHTLGHALEAATSYSRMLHGEAVAWGLLAVTRVARERGLVSGETEQRLCAAVRALGVLPPIADLEPERVLDHLARDKKRDDLGVAWVLPTDDGVVLDQRLTVDEARRALVWLQRGE